MHVHLFLCAAVFFYSFCVRVFFFSAIQPKMFLTSTNVQGDRNPLRFLSFPTLSLLLLSSQGGSSRLRTLDVTELQQILFVGHLTVQRGDLER